VANDPVLAALYAACNKAGFDPTGAETISVSENTIYRLRGGGIVARVGRVGQLEVASKEIQVALWLETKGVDAVRVLSDISQPVDVGGRPVTFWQELPPHRRGTPQQVGHVLRRLHRLDPPNEFRLPILDPFTRLAKRINLASTLSEDDRAWLGEHLTKLERRYRDLPPGMPWCVVHGDAWVGNVVSSAGGREILIDLERCALGPPEWDLASIATKYMSFGRLSDDAYQEFVHSYGYDVTSWDGFSTLRDIRELRLTLFAAQFASEDPSASDQAAHRLACLRGDAGPRPWPGWTDLS
jgi:aminoglycoside phosphotransferase